MRADAGSGVKTPVKTNATDDAIIPVDTQDSWIVGSDRMNRDTADTAKNARAFFNKAKGAFRSGTAGGAEWDDASVGTNSHAEGTNTTASGANSHAEGSSTKATSWQAHAEGFGSVASASAAHAEGNSTASGEYSHAEGSGTVASGQKAHAEGQHSEASRFAQHAKASGQFSSAGDAQMGNIVVRNLSTDATPKLLTGGITTGSLDYGGAGESVLGVRASRAFQVKISTVARRTDVQGEMAGWTWEGLVGRDATGNARIIGAPVQAAWGDAPATDAWALAVSIDTTNVTTNYVAITATGEVGKTIRWVTKIEWVEVGG